MEGGGGSAFIHDKTQVGIPEAETSKAEVKTFVKRATVVSVSVSACVSVFCCLRSRWVVALFTFSFFRHRYVPLNKVVYHFQLERTAVV